MGMKTKNFLALLLVMSMVILMAGCVNDPHKPSAGDSSGKFETSVAGESSKTEETSGKDGSGTEEAESSRTETQLSEQHQDGDIYMKQRNKTIYIERLEHCTNWLGKTFQETGLPDDLKQEDPIYFEGKIYGFAAHGVLYYGHGDRRELLDKMTVFVQNSVAKPSDLYEILVMDCGQPYQTLIGDYVEADGGNVVSDYFSTGNGTVVLETAELRTFSELIYTPDQMPEPELTEGEKALALIKEETGYDLTLPEDEYLDLTGGKIGGSELDWYYLDYTLDDNMHCLIYLVANVSEEQAAEKVFTFTETLKDKIVTENGYSMVIDEENQEGAIFWWDMDTAWLLMADYSRTGSAVDYDYLRQYRLAIIAAYEQPE